MAFAFSLICEAAGHVLIHIFFKNKIVFHIIRQVIQNLLHGPGLGADQFVFPHMGFLLKTVYGLGAFLRPGGEQAGDFTYIVLFHAVVLQGAEAAYHGQTGTAFVFHGIDQADDAHLAGQLYVRCTAGADIVSGNFHDTHLAGQFFFAAVVQLIQLFPGRVDDYDRKISDHCFIGFIFYLLKLLRCEGAVKIHGHQFLPQMKAYIVISEGAVYDTGNDVLSRVLLHFGETLLIVDGTVYLCVRLKFRIGVMDDDIVLFLHIQHVYAAQASGISVLAAALREEYGLVQNYFIALFFLIPCTGQDRCVTAVLMAVFII